MASLLSVACADVTGVRNGDEQRFLFHASPQDGAVHLTWSSVEGAKGFRVAWLMNGSAASEDTVVPPSASRVTIEGLENGRSYTFQIDARGMGSPGETAISIPRPRENCRFEWFTVYDPDFSFFCSLADFNDFLARNLIDPLDMTCRGLPVQRWQSDAANCAYEYGPKQLLLLRSADRVPAFASVMPASTVRTATRRALWPDGDPYARPERFALDRASFAPRAGEVLDYASVRGYVVRFHPELSSRVTWFEPRAPIGERFAIYLEGHGDAGVDIGAETIVWLLRRGWRVLSIDMPLFGVNAVDQTAELQNHFDFARFDRGRDSPVGLFVLPVKAAIDQIVSESGRNRRIMLIGRSGGGFTAYVAGAVDQRADFVVSIAGGTPLSTRLSAPWEAYELGDYEQYAPHLYDAVAHEQLMVASGSKGSLFTFSTFDPCCSRVRETDPFVAYLRQAGSLQRKKIEVFVDPDFVSHGLGPRGYEALEQALAGWTQ